MSDMNLASVVLTMSNEESDLFLPKSERENIKIPEVKGQDEINKFHNESKKIQDEIKQTAESLLYHWKHFSISFPPSLTGICDNIDEKDETEKNYKMRDLFIIPSFDELDEVATGGSDKARKLDKEQLKSIRKHGEFNVDSIHFPGQAHKWRLTSWLQLGSVRTNENFYKSLSNALRLIIITAKRRIISDRFSLTQSVKSWKTGTTRLFDILIGLPAMRTVPYDSKLLEEEQMFLTVELTLDRGSDPKENEKFQRFIEQYTEYENLKNKETKPKENFVVPYFYRTPENLLIDLRLYDRELIEQVSETLKTILAFDSDEDKTWIFNLRKKLIANLKNNGVNDSEMIKQVTDILYKEYLNRVYEKILSNTHINSLSPNLGRTLVDHARAILIMRDAVNQVQKIVSSHIDGYGKNLIENYKIKSNIFEWLSDCVENERVRISKKNQYKAHEIAIEQCKANNLHQAAYFLNRELIFRKEREAILIKELSKIKEPEREYKIRRAIWMPKNWIITKTQDNKPTERIHPVIIESTFIEPESVHLLNVTSTLTKERYQCNKWETYTNTSKYPFWRWTNFFLRTWAYLWNIIFFLGILVPFYSSVSFSALFRLQPFYPNKEVNPSTGHLHPMKSSRTLTFISRLRAIWRHVAKSREKFESTPDKGLISKTFQRFFNRIWNYIIKGIFGTLGVILVFPALCIIASVSCILVGLLTPLWYPIVSIVFHISYGILFDFDYAYNRRRKIHAFFTLINIFVIRYLIGGVIQPVAAIITAFVICPITSLIVTIYGITVKILRKFWDSFMFYLIIRPRARIPSHDTFFARRYAGPGLASNYFYQITVEQGLAALEAHLEIQVLKAYLSNVENIINEPLREYQSFFDGIAKPFSYTLNHSEGAVFRNMKEETDKYLTFYREAVSKREQHLRKSLAASDLSKIRLKQEDLRVLLGKASEIVQTQYKNTILKYQKKSVDDLFKEKELDENDWTIYTGILLEDIFGEGFLIPLEETDNYFHLDVNHLNLSKYSTMIANSDLRDDLDLVMARYNPKSGRIIIPIPNESPSIFNPLTDYKTYYTGISNEVDSKLNIPTRLPMHPCIISLLIYNRDNAQKQIQIKSFAYVEDLVTKDYEKI